MHVLMLHKTFYVTDSGTGEHAMLKAMFLLFITRVRIAGLMFTFVTASIQYFCSYIFIST